MDGPTNFSRKTFVIGTYHIIVHRSGLALPVMARARLATTCLVVVLLVALAGSAEYANAAQADGSDPPPAPYRVLLATPCYDGQVTHEFHLSVVRAYEHYQRQTSSGQELALESAIVPGIADLPKARAALVSQFLKRTELTHLLFVDADMKFAPELILRLARSGRDVVAAMYPKRHVNWENIAKWRHNSGNRRDDDAGRPETEDADVAFAAMTVCVTVKK